VLDRVLVSASWDGRFPLVSLSAKTRIGYDHTPLILNSGDEALPRSSRFFFENGWLLVHGFHEQLRAKSLEFLGAPGCRRDLVEVWQGQSAGLHRFLKGWSANLGRDKRKEKEVILRQIQELDGWADSSGLSEED
jgi:hypothetical protein